MAESDSAESCRSQEKAPLEGGAEFRNKLWEATQGREKNCRCRMLSTQWETVPISCEIEPQG
jgi:hypothetical protein